MLDTWRQLCNSARVQMNLRFLITCDSLREYVTLPCGMNVTTTGPACLGSGCPWVHKLCIVAEGVQHLRQRLLPSYHMPCW